MPDDLDVDGLKVFIGRRKSRAANSGLEFRQFVPLTYDIDLDMLELADTFSLHFRFTRELWNWSAPDNPIVLELNGRPICTGLLDDGKKKNGKGGTFIDITGRDKGGRLVDSAAPMINFTGLGILDLARKMVTAIGGFDLFPEVTLQNAKNRRLMAGGRGARTSGEPPIRTGVDKNDRRVRPGQTRAQVLEDWLEEAGLLGFSSADGKQFFVGRPNYDQEPQFSLFLPAPGSRRAAEGNVLEADNGESAGERYSRIIVIGSGAGNAKNFAENVQRRGVWKQGPNPDGTGAAFVVPKDLIIVDDNIHSQAAANARAAREGALRESTAIDLTVLVAGHSQAMGPAAARSNYVPDTLVRYEDEEIDASGNPREFLITRCQYSGSKMGKTTRLTMVPKGTDLRMTSG